MIFFCFIWVDIAFTFLRKTIMQCNDPPVLSYPPKGVGNVNMLVILLNIKKLCDQRKFGTATKRSMLLNVASLNIIVSKRKSFKT